MNLTPFRIHDALASDWFNAGTPDDATGLLQAIELPPLHAESGAGPVRLSK